MEEPKILLAGDSAVSVQFDTRIDPAVYQKVKSLNDRIRSAGVAGIVETVPTFRSLMIHYQPGVLSYAQLRKTLSGLMDGLETGKGGRKKTLTIPVCYGGKCGEDLEQVASYHNMSCEEVLRIFNEREYLIYMLGFTPGYPYMGGLDERLFTPRLKTPRVTIPVGSVGIGGEQVGIYPVESPGGFQLIGTTPLPLYDITKARPVLLEAGEYVRFASVSEQEFSDIRRQLEQGTYQYQIVESEA